MLWAIKPWSIRVNFVSLLPDASASTVEAISSRYFFGLLLPTDDSCFVLVILAYVCSWLAFQCKPAALLQPQPEIYEVPDNKCYSIASSCLWLMFVYLVNISKLMLVHLHPLIIRCVDEENSFVFWNSISWFKKTKILFSFYSNPLKMDTAMPNTL